MVIESRINSIELIDVNDIKKLWGSLANNFWGPVYDNFSVLISWVLLLVLIIPNKLVNSEVKGFGGMCCGL